MLLWFTREYCSSIDQLHARELNTRTQEYTAHERKVTSELYRIIVSLLNSSLSRSQLIFQLQPVHQTGDFLTCKLYNLDNTMQVLYLDEKGKSSIMGQSYNAPALTHSCHDNTQ